MTVSEEGRAQPSPVSPGPPTPPPPTTPPTRSPQLGGQALDASGGEEGCDVTPETVVVTAKVEEHTPTDSAGSPESRQSNIRVPAIKRDPSPTAMPVPTNVKSPTSAPLDVKSPAANASEQTHVSLVQECRRLGERVAEMENEMKHKEEKAQADLLGLDLLVAMQRNNGEKVEEALRLGHGRLNFHVLDASGMSALHHASRAVRLDWFQAVLQEAPSLVDVLTLWARTPSQWSCLNCAADVAKPKTPQGLLQHAAICTLLVEKSAPATIANITGHGTTVVHQLVGRGHKATLERILPIMQAKLGENVLATLMNIQVGKQKLGAVDTALRCHIATVGLLKQYGAVEQTAPPDDWSSRRRRQSTSTHNPRAEAFHEVDTWQCQQQWPAWGPWYWYGGASGSGQHYG